MKSQSYSGHKPKIGPSNFIAEGSVLIGRVELGADSSVFYNCTLRADINSIGIGSETNIQDNCVVHVADDAATVVGNRVSVGHSCVLHACTVGDNVLVGMGTIIMDGAVVEKNSIIAAGSLISRDKKFPPGSLILGRPARVERALTEDEIKSIQNLAEKYVRVKNSYLESPR